MDSSERVVMGDKSRFAVELEAWQDAFASIAVWIAGTRLGDVEEVSVRGALLSDVIAFLGRESLGVHDVPAHRSADEVAFWFRTLIGLDVDDTADVKSLDSLIRSVWLFAYAPEGLASVHVVVGCSDGVCRITGWDEYEGVGPVQTVIDEAELRAVLGAVSEWLA